LFVDIEIPAPCASTHAAQEERFTDIQRFECRRPFAEVEDMGPILLGVWQPLIDSVTFCSRILQIGQCSRLGNLRSLDRETSRKWVFQVALGNLTHEGDRDRRRSENKHTLTWKDR